MLSQDELKEVLHYDRETGDFAWRITGKGRNKDKSAGCLGHFGYVEIGISGKIYKAHRLAWLYVYGYFPENDIDHIDRVRNNNSIGNLREASRSCNLRNSGLMSTNTSGIKGVSFYSRDGKWEAHIKINNKRIHLGRFTDKLEAAKARHEAEIEYNFSDCDTNSTALRYILEKNDDRIKAREGRY